MIERYNAITGIPVSGAIHAVLDHLLEGCQAIGYDWRYVYLNDAAVRHSRKRREELLGHKIMECYPGIEHTPAFALMAECMDMRKAGQLENLFTYPDGSTSWFEIRVEPIPTGIFVLSIDITARKNAEECARLSEEKLRHSQKMDAMGRLAAGVAHDVNNLLTVILSSSSELHEQLPRDSGLNEAVDMIRESGAQVAELMRHLLTFSRQQSPVSAHLDLKALITGCSRMLRRLIGNHVEIVLDLSPDTAEVVGDHDEIEKVMLNLATNARDAMPQGGRLLLETRNVHLDEAYAQAHLNARPGPHVLLKVSDTGCGMTPDTLAHIFEPFFTTKPPGLGTGLGLSTVFGVVRQFGGHIHVDSAPGQGTTFLIYLPATQPRELRESTAGR